ncbi:class II fumarate hydratase [Lactobacillus sp. S2-2]|uniref:class II fumarate hydratase n=1 Tax=Lactobacillus sp. S2-2 TaxID=2692917 RepID=UPI001F287794|nr:class II fumarate hydratase [Lactobacillus sp. S2-2]MCF6514671.1 class II fumarate hydratase [Lactobacillus sp. S2-2]
MDYRVESDSIGEVKVPKDALWGAQTQRSRFNFPNGPTMPVVLIRSLIKIKKCVAKVNLDNKKIDEIKGELIVQTCDNLLSFNDEELMKDFPLHIYQTGSGTQTNMNVNEVIVNLAYEINPDVKLLANDDVNRCQSSNDVFPTAMNIAIIKETESLMSSLKNMKLVLQDKEIEFSEIVKIGRTHLQDATPLTVGQEISGWVSTIDHDIKYLNDNINAVYEIPIGGTAVGTGMNTYENFDKFIVNELSKETGLDLKVQNKFFGLASHSTIVNFHSSVKVMDTDLMKIANDIRFLSSGPRAGYGEFIIPSNEPGSSIMPGKVNPTQAEALIMAATKVVGNDTTIGLANSQGNFELNVYKPLIIDTVLESIQLMAGLIKSFTDKLIKGLEVNSEQMKKLVNESLMTVTSLSPHIGYHKAAEIAQFALKNKLNLKEAAIKTGYVNENDFNNWVDPYQMTNKKTKS